MSGDRCWQCHAPWPPPIEEAECRFCRSPHREPTPVCIRCQLRTCQCPPRDPLIRASEVRRVLRKLYDGLQQLREEMPADRERQPDARNVLAAAATAVKAAAEGELGIDLDATKASEPENDNK